MCSVDDVKRKHSGNTPTSNNMAHYHIHGHLYMYVCICVMMATKLCYLAVDMLGVMRFLSDYVAHLHLHAHTHMSVRLHANTMSGLKHCRHTQTSILCKFGLGEPAYHRCSQAYATDTYACTYVPMCMCMVLSVYVIGYFSTYLTH